MSQLTVTVLQLGLLVLLWLFVLGVVAVLRRDLFGARAPRPAPAPVRAAPAPAPARAAPAGTGPPAPPRPAPGTRARVLAVTEGPLAGTHLDLDGSPVLLGRAPDCTLVLGDDYASGHHARLVPDPGSPGGWVLEDLGSTNGTSLGRGSSAARVTGTAPVGAGSVVRIGRTTLELRS